MNDKFIYQPVSPFHINQKFGENQICVDLETGRKVIECDGTKPPAGFRSLYGKAGHKGLDLRSYHGQEVYCAQRGRVDFIDTQERSGLDVRVVSTIYGQAYRHIYEHLMGYQPQVGDYLETGQLIGWADNTGYSSGDHLHFQLEKWVNGVWVPIDPLPHMASSYAKNVLAVNNTLKYVKEQLALIADRLAFNLRKNA